MLTESKNKTCLGWQAHPLMWAPPGKLPVTLLKLIRFWGEFGSLNLSGAKTNRKEVRLPPSENRKIVMINNFNAFPVETAIISQ